MRLADHRDLDTLESLQTPGPLQAGVLAQLRMYKVVLLLCPLNPPPNRNDPQPSKEKQKCTALGVHATLTFYAKISRAQLEQRLRLAPLGALLAEAADGPLAAP